MNSEYITTADELRRHFPSPGERAIRKQLSRLDRHCRRFIELSPFVVMASWSGESLDSSPRGGAPGFVHVADDTTLWIPDSPGNNRLDSLTNIIATARIGLLFLIPGVDETLRVNGAARISTAPDKLQHFSNERRAAKLIVEVTVEEAFLHCAKALMRSSLWADSSRVDRASLPTLGEMLADQTETSRPAETQAEMVARYQREL